MVVITTHGLADIDALASAALLHFKYGHPIILSEHPNHEAKSLAKIYNIPYSVESSISDEVILVDTSHNPFNTPVVKGYDHHNCTNNPNIICDPKAPSTGYLLFREENLPLQPPYTDLIILSILSDTHRFKSLNDPSIFKDLALLLEHASKTYQELLSLIDQSLSYSERLVLSRSFSNYSIYKEPTKKLIFLFSDCQSYQSKVSLHLVEGLGADLGIAYAEVDEELRVAGRASPVFPVDLGLLFESIARELSGRGGGHPKAASMNLPLSSITSLEKTMLKHLNSKGLNFVLDNKN